MKHRHPTELQFQEEILRHLEVMYYTRLSSSDYDRSAAIVWSEFEAFARETQGQLLKSFGIQKVKKALCRALDQHGSLHVWRKGFRVQPNDNRVFRIAYWKPESAGHPRAEARYRANRLAVIDELEYDTVVGADANRLDLVFFVNGVPVMTAELKNAFTGQAVGDAVEQYRTDRRPGADLFSFPHRAIVHFAIDRDDVMMATRLAGAETHFLPFNRGTLDGKKGNPAIPGDHRTAYMWRTVQTPSYPGSTETLEQPAVWSRDRMLETLQSFATLEPLSDKEAKGKNDLEQLRAKTLIFPRYHQYDAVRRLVEDTRRRGAGHKYLVKHSTGSGKSYSMAWLAHKLASLHSENGTAKVFDTVLMVTDRVQLDKQLRALVKEVDETANVHEATQTEGLGKMLTEVPEGVSSTRIITSTIQKFWHLLKSPIEGVIGRNVAIIIDEAHRSQGGKLQGAMEKVIHQLSQHAEGGALSYYAFTATPSGATLDLFGEGPKDDRRAFHVYGMRQAREEGFIVDVLRNMESFQQAIPLAAVREEQRVKGVRPHDLQRAAAGKPEAVATKVERILDHFIDRHQLHRSLDGQAKAMILAPSITAGIRYTRALRRALADRGARNAEEHLNVLLAFSGREHDPDVEKPVGVKDPRHMLDEKRVNAEGPDGVEGAEGTKIAELLRESHDILVAVDKFQTGFNEPRLMAMYVDKRLRGSNAVQTLSRLNRPFKKMKMRGKAYPHVVDFVNPLEEIIQAFIAEDEGTREVYRYVTPAYIETLFQELAPFVELLPTFLELEADYTESANKRGVTRTDAKQYGAFFSQIEEAHVSASDDVRHKVVSDLAKYVRDWRLATLTLRADYPRDEPLYKDREDFFRFATLLHRHLGRRREVGDDTRFSERDVEVPEGENVAVLPNTVPILEWIEHADEAQPASADDAAVEPKVYRSSRRRRPLTRRLVELVERWNREVGFDVESAVSAGVKAGGVVVLQQVAKAAHRSPRMQALARQNSEAVYTERFPQTVRQEIRRAQRGGPDQQTAQILKLMRNEDPDVWKDLASDSYRVHRGENREEDVA